MPLVSIHATMMIVNTVDFRRDSLHKLGERGPHLVSLKFSQQLEDAAEPVSHAVIEFVDDFVDGRYVLRSSMRL